MVTRTLSDETSSTIIGGIFQLFAHGSYFVAVIILLVSVIIPVVKFILIAWLTLSVQFNWIKERHTRHLSYELIEKIGRLEPGIGINSFALMVVLSMLAAESFDSRLIWDQTGDNSE